MKDSFILYTSFGDAVASLSDEDAGRLLKGLYAYHRDQDVDLPPLPKLLFLAMLPKLQEDAAKYEQKLQARREAGAKGGVASGTSRRKQTKQNEANEANASSGKQTKQPQANEADMFCFDLSLSEKENTHTPLPPSQGGGACVPSVPLCGEDIAERQDGARQERRKGDYEFSLLRDAYDKARQEGPMAGRQEFLSLFHSQEWPGIDELIASVEKLCAEDDQFRRGFAPGLAKFIQQRMWRMKPRAPAGEREPEMTPERQEQKRRHMEERRQFEEKMAKLKKQKGGSCG